MPLCDAETLSGEVNEPTSGVHEWQPQVGDRVSCSGHLGSVRYVGPVEGGSGGEWIGVEWDDPGRGRHNGTVAGRCYFSTQHATGGSLVRCSKLTRPVTCCQSVVERYGDGADHHVIDDSQVNDLERDLNARFVRIIGMQKIGKKQSAFANLTEVFLRGCCINGDRPPRIGQLCPNVRDLDISQNLFTSWRHVAEITRQLTHLEQLNVSENALPDPDPSLRPAFSTVRALFLNRQNYTWQQVVQCAEMWPDITALTLLSNNISDITEPPQHLFRKLTYLELEDNPIEQWSSVMCLSAMPELSELSLINTRLTSINMEGSFNSISARSFPRLSSLLLCRTCLSDWRSVDALNAFPSLTRLKLTDTPLNAGARCGESVRCEVIARVAGLTVLNKSAVSREERRWAELDYLRRYGRSWSDSGGRLPQQQRQTDLWQGFVRDHCRYEALCEKWGAPEEAELKKTSSTISANSVHVKVICKSADGSIVGAQYEKTLPLAMRCGKLKTLVNRLFGGQVSRLHLSSCMPDRPDFEVEMNQDKDLNFYCVEDGYFIIARYL